MKPYCKIKAVILWTSFWLLVSFASNANIAFVENDKQWPEKVQYMAEIPGGRLWVEQNTLTYVFVNPEDLHEYHHNRLDDVTANLHAVKLHFKNANPNAKLTASKPFKTIYNFYYGNDPDLWSTNLRGFQRLYWKDIYPNIDLEILGNDDFIKYNFIVRPGGNPDDILMEYEGQDELYLSDEGHLKVVTSIFTFEEKAPYVFQENHPKDGSDLNEVKSKFKVDGQKVSFKVRRYDKNQNLIIDPEVIFATYSGSNSDNWGYTATYDDEEHAYSGGTVYGPSFPVTAGAYKETWSGGSNDEELLPGNRSRDVGILKFSADGSELLYASYLGGRRNEQPHSMVVDDNGNLYVLGTTNSTDFPVSTTAFQRQNGGTFDMFITKFSADGSRLLSSTYLGGSAYDGLNGFMDPTLQMAYRNHFPTGHNYGDMFRGEIIHRDGFIYVGTSIQSLDLSLAPYNKLNRPFQGDQQSGLVLKMHDHLGTLDWAAFIGGSKADAVFGIDLDRSGNVIAVGGTNSSDFPVTENAFQGSFQGGETDGFVTKISADGDRILSSSYFGTSDYDQVYFVETDAADHVYLLTQTLGWMPPRNVAASYGNHGLLIAKMTPDFSDVLFNGYLGKTHEEDTKRSPISPSAFMVDICENIYVSGWGGRTNDRSRAQGGNVFNLPITGNAIQQQTDGADFYLALFEKNMHNLYFASYFGGNRSAEHVDGGTSRFDRNGIVYQALCGGCWGNSDFPTTEGAWSERNPSNLCNNAYFKIKMELTNSPPEVDDQFYEVNVLDTLRFEFDVKDPNYGDSVYLRMSNHLSNRVQNELTMQPMKGPEEFTVSGSWVPVCEDLKENEPDTFEIRIWATDNGCGGAKSSVANITIVVHPLPMLDAPDLFCALGNNENNLEINWRDPFGENAYAFKKMHMMKYKEGESIENAEKLGTIKDPNQRKFVDESIDWWENNLEDFCYYIEVENHCGHKAISEEHFCLSNRFDTVPDAVTMRNVTVEDNEFLAIHWDSYEKNDFFQYVIYRKPKDRPDEEEQIITLFNEKDTAWFYDKMVNVHEKAYCYEIELRNSCGAKSERSKPMCSIHLSGESIPFQHHLNWNPFHSWPNEVKQYHLMRRDPVVDLDGEAVFSGKGQNFEDTALNYDVGIYHYKVVAEENKNGSNRDPQESISNEVELIQSPHLHIPNAFTPNSDGVNDEWWPVPAFVKDYKLSIYNRWGEKLFETTDKNQGWDGEASKPYRKLDNVVIYMITYTGWDGSIHYEKGNVTLLK